jgi:hypothetical protein
MITWQKQQQCLAIGNWVHQMFVVFLSGLVLLSAAPTCFVCLLLQAG